MTEQHPITPPQELVTEWWNKCNPLAPNLIGQFAIQAACWGADQELEACVKWIEDCGYHPSVAEDIRDARRPKPLTLKEQALVVLDDLRSVVLDDLRSIDATHYNILRNALEQLND